MRRSTGDASRLKHSASRRSSLRFGRNTLGPVLPVGAPPSRALSAGRLAPTGRTGRSRRSHHFIHRLLTAGGGTQVSAEVREAQFLPVGPVLPVGARCRAPPCPQGYVPRREPSPRLGSLPPRPCGPLCRPPPGELARGRRSLASAPSERSASPRGCIFTTARVAAGVSPQAVEPQRPRIARCSFAGSFRVST